MVQRLDESSAELELVGGGGCVPWDNCVLGAQSEGRDLALA